MSAVASAVHLRGTLVALPSISDFGIYGIALQNPPRVRTFELCRYFAETRRDAVLATAEERRVSVPPDLKQILQLEEWHHPDVAGGERPSRTKTFQQLAQVLESGDVTLYKPTEPANTHWRNWPEGGLL